MLGIKILAAIRHVTAIRTGPGVDDKRKTEGRLGEYKLVKDCLEGRIGSDIKFSKGKTD